MENGGPYAPTFGRCAIGIGDSNGYEHPFVHNPRTYYLIKQEFFGIDNCHAIVKNSSIRKNANRRCLESIAFVGNSNPSHLTAGHVQCVSREIDIRHSVCMDGIAF